MKNTISRPSPPGCAAGGTDSSESISGHHKRLQIRALSGCVSDPKEYFKISNHTLLVIIFVLELVLFLYNAIIQKYYPTWISNMQKKMQKAANLSCFMCHVMHRIAITSTVWVICKNNMESEPTFIFNHDTFIHNMLEKSLNEKL